MHQCVGGIFIGLVYGDTAMVSPFLYMPVWWNGIHSGLRNRGESMRVRISPQVLNHVRIAERYRRCTKDAVGKPVEVRILLRTLYTGLVKWFSAFENG